MILGMREHESTFPGASSRVSNLVCGPGEDMAVHSAIGLNLVYTEGLLG